MLANILLGVLASEGGGGSLLDVNPGIDNLDDINFFDPFDYSKKSCLETNSYCFR